MILSLLLACGPDFDGSFEFVDATNYTYASAIDIGSVDVTVAQDFALDWSGLSADLLGESLDPSVDITNLTLLSFPELTQEEIEAAVAEDALLQSDVDLLALMDTEGATSAMLSDFTLGFTTPLVPDQHFVDTQATWLLRATTGLLDTRMLTFLRLVEDGGATSVTLDNTSSTLQFTVDLASLAAFEVPADADVAEWTADWSALSMRGNGAEFDASSVDQFQIARLDMELTEVEADFIHLETIAAELYTAQVAATSVSLVDAVSADGAAFAGFGSGDLWIMALRCSTCANPAPPYVTVVRSAGK